MEAERISYRYVKNEAELQNNKRVLRELQKIGEPPHSEREALIRANCQGRIGGITKKNPPKSIVSLLRNTTREDLNYRNKCNFKLDYIGIENYQGMDKTLRWYVFT